jgi:[2Fe-2S] binding domain/FAD binding domain in molybdopterin dehydrogenase
MKPPPFEYLDPTSVDEALALLQDHGEEAKVLAGGQSLVPLMNFRLAQPRYLVDLNRTPELAVNGRNYQQCGFCTPGFLMTLYGFLRDCPQPSEAEIREAIAGNLCRCTGYQNVVIAAKPAAQRLSDMG